MAIITVVATKTVPGLHPKYGAIVKGRTYQVDAKFYPRAYFAPPKKQAAPATAGQEQQGTL